MELMMHLKTHNTNFNCKECRFTSSSQFAFEIHMQNDHIPKAQSHQQQVFLSCKVCGMIFADQLDLEGHVTRQHKASVEINLESDSNSDKQKENESFKCDKCTFITTEEVVFRQHILTKHIPGFECHECEAVIKPKDLVTECEVCYFFYP
jgi:uncharacterized C2H2 Zn-finger protein